MTPLATSPSRTSAAQHSRTLDTSPSDSSALAAISAEQILLAISKAMQAKDMPAVAALIRLLAVKEPRTAEIMMDAIDLAAS